MCEGTTGHVEVVQLVFDKSKAPYEELVKFFFTFHDPTTLNRQGNDTGSQYASAIFCHSDDQMQVAERVKQMLQDILSNQSSNEQNFETKQVETIVCRATKFYAAEADH